MSFVHHDRHAADETSHEENLSQLVNVRGALELPTRKANYETRLSIVIVISRVGTFEYFVNDETERKEAKHVFKIFSILFEFVCKTLNPVNEERGEKKSKSSPFFTRLQTCRAYLLR